MSDVPEKILIAIVDRVVWKLDHEYGPSTWHLGANIEKRCQICLEYVEPWYIKLEVDTAKAILVKDYKELMSVKWPH